MKQKTFFDFLNVILKKQNIDWHDLSEEDKKQLNVYMLHRYLSMNIDWIEIVKFVQCHTFGLDPKFVYMIYNDIIPKSNAFLKYIKGNKISKIPEIIIDTVKLHYECSTKEAIEYIELLNKEDLIELVRKYGIDINKNKDFKTWIK